LTIISAREPDGRPKRTSRKSKKISRVSKDGRGGLDPTSRQRRLEEKIRDTKKVGSLWIICNKIGDAFNNISVMLRGKPRGN
jgi:hypothetical protein